MFSSWEITFMRQFPEEDHNFGENLYLLDSEHQPKKEWIGNPLRPTDPERLTEPYTLWGLKGSKKNI